jgi:hypothetical protein
VSLSLLSQPLARVLLNLNLWRVRIQEAGKIVIVVCGPPLVDDFQRRLRFGGAGITQAEYERVKAGIKICRIITSLLSW